MASYLEETGEALVKAVVNNNLLRAQQALWRGANPEITDDTHTPMLHLALNHGDDAMVAALLKAGANPHRIDPSCRSALVLAQRMGRREAAAMMQAISA